MDNDVVHLHVIEATIKCVIVGRIWSWISFLFTRSSSLTCSCMYRLRTFKLGYYGSSMPLPLSFIRMLEQLYKCLVFYARIWSSLLPQLYRYLIILVLLFKKMSFFNKRDSLKPLPAFRISIKASMNGSSRLSFCSKVANYSLMGIVSWISLYSRPKILLGWNLRNHRW